MLAMASGRSAKRRPWSAEDFHMAFGVARQQASGFGERDLVVQTGEDVQQLTLPGCDVAGTVSGDEGNVHAASQFDDGLVADFLVAADDGAESRRRRSRVRRCARRRSSVGAASPLLRARASGPCSSPVRQMRPSAYSASSSGVAAEGSCLPTRSLVREIRRQRFW